LRIGVRWLPRQYTQIAIDPKLLDAYVGRYEIRKDVILAVRREGDHLSIHQEGSKHEQRILPESSHLFFTNDSVLEYDFVIGEHNRVTELTVDSNGFKWHAKRIEDTH